MCLSSVSLWKTGGRSSDELTLCERSPCQSSIPRVDGFETGKERHWQHTAASQCVCRRASRLSIMLGLLAARGARGSGR